jgi:hypothetical protein
VVSALGLGPAVRARIRWRCLAKFAIPLGMEATLMPHGPALSGPVLRYRNREIGEAELQFLRATIARCTSRKQLYDAVCAAWNWRQMNGAPSLVACQDLLLRLEERGHLQLPASRRRTQGKSPRREIPLLPQELVPLSWIPVAGSEVSLASLVVRPIAPEERLGWRLFMARYHYLRQRPIVGEHLLYAAFIGDDLVALLGWASAALHVPARERFVGWEEQTKRQRLRLVANNVRFLIPPWVRVKCLASRVLALCLRRLSRDWQAAWGHPILLAETFVDTARFKGTCYRAANWSYLGQTAGRSKRGNDYSYNNAPKAVFVYPLHRHACRLLRKSEP